MGSIIGSIFRDFKCATYNGTDEVSYNLNPAFKSQSSGSFSLWFYLPSILGTTGNIPLISFGDTSGSNDSVLAINVRRHPTTGTGNYISMFVRATNGGTSYGVSGTTTAISAATWYHAVAQCNGSAWSLYVNGVSQTVTVWSTSNTGVWMSGISGTNHRIAFGANYIGGSFTNYGAVRINEAINVNRILTAGEVTSLYNSGSPRNPHRVFTVAGELRSWWRFGDSRDDGSMIYDEIGSEHLTNANMDSSNYVTP